MTTHPPDAIAVALAQLYCLGQLLQGFNPEHVNTAAAPTPEALASLVFAAHAEISSAVSETFEAAPRA